MYVQAKMVRRATKKGGMYRIDWYMKRSELWDLDKLMQLTPILP